MTNLNEQVQQEVDQVQGSSQRSAFPHQMSNQELDKFKQTTVDVPSELPF
jgi:hypothetical protein